MPTPSLLIVPARFKTGKLYSQIPTSGAGDFTVTRNTEARRFDSAGLVASVASGIPRLDYFTSGGVTGCPALLVEPAATNGIRNNSMNGAVTGTPGTLPTAGGWANSLLGLTQTIIGTGTENGISYIDIRFSGTATTTDVAETRYESTTQIDAASGQTWTHSVYLKKIAEPNPPSNYQLNIYERTVAGGYVANGASTVVPTTTNLQRFSQTRTLSGALTAKVQPGLFYSVVSGTAYNFTIRIGYPQMETGSVATSVIPTTAGTGSRSADVISVSGAVSGSIGQTEGTVYVEVDVSNRLNGTAAIALAKDANVSGRVIIYTNTSNRWRANYTDASGNVVDTSAANDSQVLGVNKLAFAYGAGGNATVHCNGSLIITLSGTSTFVQELRAVFLGSSNGGALFFNNRIRAAALYTTRLTNAELQSLTQL